MMINYTSFFDFWNTLVVLTTFFVIISLFIRLKSRLRISDSLKFFIITCFSVVVIICFGLRDVNVGTDTFTYFIMYNSYVSGSYDRIKDLGFYAFIQVISVFGKTWFLFFCALLYMLPIICTFTRKKAKVLGFLLLISSFFFLSLGINVMRQGVALSIGLMGLMFLINNKKGIQGYVMLLLATLFHFSALLLLVFYLIGMKVSLKQSLFVYFTAIIIAFLGGGFLEYVAQESFLKDLVSPRVDMYLNSMNTTTYKVGFRLDYIIYNSFFLLLALYSIKHIFSDISKTRYLLIVKVYILLSSIFFLSFYIPFSDRLGVISWILIPLIMVPIFSKLDLKHTLISSFVFLSNCLLYFYI